MVPLSLGATLLNQDRPSKPRVLFGTTHFLPGAKKWVAKLFGYDYEIIYKKGKYNVVTDALSRKYEEEVYLFSLSFIVHDWLQAVR